MVAERLFVEVGKKEKVSEREEYNFAAVHLFFQCALIALVFAVLSTLANQQIKIIFFPLTIDIQLDIEVLCS